MPIDTQHPDYRALRPQWLRARAILAGEEAVKLQGASLLPQLAGHDPDEYDAYRKRANFYNAAARTAQGYIGMVYRRPATIRLSEGLFPTFETDADLLGTALQDYGRQVLTEVIQVGRCGTLINWDDSTDRPHCVLYPAEDIVNWQVERVRAKFRATRVVLREWHNIAADEYETELAPQYRVLKLNRPSADFAAPFVTVELWREHGGNFFLVEKTLPLCKGDPLPCLPFVFHGPSHSRASVAPLPLGDMIAVNLDHYRLDADYKHGLHFTALPTAWLAGFGPQTELTIGSSSVWMSDNPQARAGYLEYFGHGLTSFERALERDERLMAVLGSRLLEPQKRAAETAEAIQLRTAGEESILGNIARAVSQSLTEVLRWAAWWGRAMPATPDELPEADALYSLNQDFGTNGLAAGDLQALVAGWQAGAFSHDTLLHLLRKGEVLPDGRTNDEERSLLTKSSKPS
jgi:hypothetical protein